MPRADSGAGARFSGLRYAQCWEDADVLLRGLDVGPGDVCLSIGSAGDNTLALLSRGPGKVVALDLNPAQIACLELRVAAYSELEHGELLELVGSRPSARRAELYRRCRPHLSPGTGAFWDARAADVDRGVGGAGKFEHYLGQFRARLLPLIHSPARIERLLRGGTRREREEFYTGEWDTWTWRQICRLFFSRRVMGWLGRDATSFRYVNGRVADRILERARYALTVLNPSENPYLQWILTGQHGSALPYSLRPENFAAIRANLGRLEWRCEGLEGFLRGCEPASFDSFNLSDVFETLSVERYGHLIEMLARSGRPGARLAYWNVLAERRRPERLKERVRPLLALASRLHAEDKAFFYGAYVLEEVVG